MKTTLWKLAAITGISAAALTAAHADPAAGPNRPAAVPANYAITPFGYFDRSCVIRLAKGDTLLKDEKSIRHTDGSSTAMHVCAYPHYRPDGESIVGDERPDRHPNISHAWIEYASVTTKSSYGYLYGEWTVPPAPAANDGQTLFFFPGMEDIQDVVTIIQPVLGWNSDYASSWGIASWNCCESGSVYEATPAPVSSGDTILGYMYDTCAKGTESCSSWDIVTQDLQNGNSSTLSNTSSFGQTFNWAFAGAVEVYGIKQCTDFPTSSAYPSGYSMSFNDLGLFNDKLVQIANPGWKVTNNAGGLTPKCSYGGSNPRQVILNY